MSSNIIEQRIKLLVKELIIESDKFNDLLSFNMPTLQLKNTNSMESISASIAIAALIQGLYTKTEEIFKLIASNIDRELPSGDAWHKELLVQMMIETNERKAVISKETFSKLNEIRAFRHIVRNSYATSLEPFLIIKNAELCQNAIKETISDLTTLIDDTPQDAFNCKY